MTPTPEIAPATNLIVSTAPETAPAVLIVGAGPTGLVLAIALTRAGIFVRIVDKSLEAGTTSRALAIHARTLEFYDQFGFADRIINAGVAFEAVNLWAGNRHVAHVKLGAIGRDLSPHAHIVILPQDDHEKLLEDELAKLGVHVERGHTLTGATQTPTGTTAQITTADGRETQCAFAYIAGCDGARSQVRHAINARFDGGTYEHVFYVADVEGDGALADGDLHVALDAADFLAIFPRKGTGRVRLVGTIKDTVDHEMLTFADVSPLVLERLPLKINNVAWFSTYHVHHRVASTFRKGRMFLLGDAAHIHSPVGGQGMNTGIGDAINLAWKLAAVLRGADEAVAERLLDSYQTERRAFALKLVATTDRAFTFVTSSGPLARFVRLHIVPNLLPFLVRFTFFRRFMFRTVSQIGIGYHDSPLSFNGDKTAMGRAIHSGNRLPWVQWAQGESDNFTSLASRNWQVHVYGDADMPVVKTCEELDVPLHVFSWSQQCANADLRRDALYLIRPDGYIAWCGPAEDLQTLRSWAKHCGAI